MLGGCQISKPRAQKRLERIIELYPELVERDTVVVHDTIITEKKIVVPEYRDSFVIEHDTIIETKEVIIEKIGPNYKFLVKKKEIEIRDTIFKETKVPGKVIKLEPTPRDIIIYLLSGFVVGVLVVAFIRAFK